MKWRKKCIFSTTKSLFKAWAHISSLLSAEKGYPEQLWNGSPDFYVALTQSATFNLLRTPNKTNLMKLESGNAFWLFQE